MGIIRILVATGVWVFSGSQNRVQLWLVGAQREAELELQLRPRPGEVSGWEPGYPPSARLGLQSDVGEMMLRLVDDAWFCDRIMVQGPGTSAETAFPCYRWVQGKSVLSLPEGTACLAGDNALDIFQKHRKKELEERQAYLPGYPLKIAADTENDLPPDMSFHEGKRLDYEWTAKTEAREVVFKCIYTLLTSWTRLEEFDQIFWGPEERPEKVHQRWQEDELFGYRFLNGANPMLLRCSTSLPSRLVLPPGTEELGAQLKKELQVLPPILRLFLGSLPKIMLQTPTPSSPTPTLFLPSDPPLAWLLAKSWVQNSDFQLHEFQYHLLNTHLLGEDIAVATMRCLPGLYSVFKLLAPHVHNTMEINTRGWIQFNSDEGIFAKAVSTGGGGHLDLAGQAMTPLTDCSLCPPDDLADRGLLGIPSALCAYDLPSLSRYVEGIIHLFNQRNDVVRGDPELQAWCWEITEVGLCHAQDGGKIHLRDRSALETLPEPLPSSAPLRQNPNLS
uniref:Uncharacterized protein n=1 Tax=Spermophilus dauricus TaxID=99837 RepID=A0A8C9QS17_SPEDA